MTTIINNENKKLNVPNLRFPEFQGEWEKCILGDYGKVVTGNTPPTKDIENYENGTYLWASPADLSAIKLISETKTKLSSKGFSKTRALPKGSVLVTCIGSTIGKTGMATKEMSTNQQINSIVVNDNNDNEFVFYAIQSAFPRYLSSIAVQAVPIISKSAFEMLPNKRTCLQEQKKIGKFLSLLDERIATQNKIIDKLQSLIKGIVDCTILRKEKNAIIGEVCSISEQIRAEANIDDIITVRLHGNGVCKSSAENLQLGATQYYRRRAGQLIYGKQNFHNGAIGIVPISLDNGITSKDIPSFDIDEMKCNSVYLLAQLQSPQYYKPAEALTTGTGSKRLKEETFLKMPIVLPNKREQDNIAVLIHRASMNLDHAKRLLELLSIQKQFLLRQMFI